MLVYQEPWPRCRYGFFDHRRAGWKLAFAWKLETYEPVIQWSSRPVLSFALEPSKRIAFMANLLTMRKVLQWFPSSQKSLNLLLFNLEG